MDRAGKDKAIGIDLGTTYSCVGVWQHDRVEIIPNDQGNRVTPSMVAFTRNDRLIGDAAKFQISTNPTNTVFEVKRLIGRRYDDPSVQSDKQFWPFTIVPGKNDKPVVEVAYRGEKRLFAPEEISSMVLARMKMTADQYLNCDVKNAVITVPAYFNDSQKRATKDAGKIAGLNVMRIINEPTAAALTYGYGSLEEKKNILVFDLGGGTFDVSVVTVERGKVEVKAVGGDMRLGGEDFDNRLLSHCVELFNKKHKMDMRTSHKALRRLRSECERAKRSLSSAVETVIDIDSLYEGNDFHTMIRRAKFEELNADLFHRCMQLVMQCMQDSRMSKHQINDIVLIGGSSRIPKVQDLLSQFFERKELCRSINPDEAVEYGAALQAAALNEEDMNLVLVDVTPLSLGMEISDGVMEIVVPRNTSIPTLKEVFVTTRFDNQTTVTFRIYEGESPLVANNNFLGEFVLDGILPARSDVPQIKVCFEVDVEGILRASAQDMGTGLENKITVINERERLNKEEIDGMVDDAEMFRKEDEEMAKNRLAKNNLECYVSNMKDKVKEAMSNGRITRRVADSITGKLDAVEEWLDENGYASEREIQTKLDQLSRTCRSLK